jgi:hypothetical protein
MAWGCISSKGVGRPVFIDGIMDRYQYTIILANNLGLSASQMDLDRFVFQQDNNLKNTSLHVKEFFEAQAIEVLK